MKNQEIKQWCIEQQEKQGANYPDYKFKITQTATEVRIGWEYIDFREWTIDKLNLIIKNEHGDFMNDELEYMDDLEDIVKSIVYYMNSRY